jgi:alpha-L-arabinofuranosidase
MQLNRILLILLLIFTIKTEAIPLVFEQTGFNIIEDEPINFTVDAASVLKNSIHNPSGAVLCWLTDSDIERPRNRSMETALTEMKAGALRFPYGALSNNYIWTKNPENINNGLEPCVAVSSRAPANWSWATDEQGYFKKDLGFDEYVALCRKVGAEPVVCVNIMSHVYNNNDDITIDTLIYYAKEWVRYANITKGYGIKYWQLGNEQDHHSDIYPLESFKVDYKKMAAGMHEIDASIKTAPGLLQKWNNTMLSYCPEYVNFITCHQYLWFGGSETEAYDVWKNYGSNLIPNITKNKNYVHASSKPELEIFITETGITGGKYPDSDVFNLYKALILFEMQMEQISTPNVKYTFYWGTHLPWNGEFGDNPIATLFSNDNENENHLQADVLSAINNNIQAKLIGKSSKDKVVTYSTLSENDSLMVIFALNKNESSKNIKITTENIAGLNKFEKWVFAGESEFDTNVEFNLEEEGDFIGNVIETTLPPLSINVIRIKSGTTETGSNSIFIPNNKNSLKIYPNPASEKVTIKTNQLKGKTSLKLYNTIGKPVFVRSLNSFGNDSYTFSVEQLPRGAYFMVVSDESGNFNKSKLIVK